MGCNNTSLLQRKMSQKCKLGWKKKHLAQMKMETKHLLRYYRLFRAQSEWYAQRECPKQSIRLFLSCLWADNSEWQIYVLTPWFGNKTVFDLAHGDAPSLGFQIHKSSPNQGNEERNRNKLNVRNKKLTSFHCLLLPETGRGHPSPGRGLVLLETRRSAALGNDWCQPADRKDWVKLCSGPLSSSIFTCVMFERSIDTNK